MPGLRQNITDRLTHELRIDPEFAVLIPPLLPDEFAQLEQSILSEGCRDAIIVWGNIIVDGHNRYRICTAHNIPYRTETRDFKDRNEAMLWMFQNQLARRNLTDFQRIEMVRRFEQAVKARAKERQGTRTDLSDNPMEKFPQATPVPLKSAQRNIVPKSAGSRSRDELAQMAGVGHSTYEQATAVLDNAPEAVVKAARTNELSINSAYQVTKLPEKQQQIIAERISQGEKPRDVVADVRRQKATYWDKLLKNAEKTAKDGKDIEAVLNLLEQAVAILKSAAQTGVS